MDILDFFWTFYLTTSAPYGAIFFYFPTMYENLM